MFQPCVDTKLRAQHKMSLSTNPGPLMKGIISNRRVKNDVKDAVLSSLLAVSGVFPVS